MLALTRARRKNAGSRIAKLLEEHEEDEFYKTVYGGFEETEDDEDYVQRECLDNIYDSDFSEEDLLMNSEEQKSKEKQDKGAEVRKGPSSKSKKQSNHNSMSQNISSKQKRQNKPPDLRRKSLRTSTVLKSKATHLRLEKLQMENKLRNKAAVPKKSTRKRNVH